jgi:putative membrane protein
VVILGIFALGLGIIYHVQFTFGLRNSRKELIAEALIRRKTHFPISSTLIIAITLFVLSVMVITSMIFGVGPFK